MGRVGGYDRAGGPLREGLIEEAVAVGAVAGERDKQVAGTDLTAVERDAGDGEVGQGGARGGSGDFGGRPEHQILPKRAWGGGPAKLVEGRRAQAAVCDGAPSTTGLRPAVPLLLLRAGKTDRGLTPHTPGPR